MTDYRAGAEARLRAIFGRKARGPGSMDARPVRDQAHNMETQAGCFGLLCQVTEGAWVGSRSINEKERWDQVNGLLDDASAEFRWRVAGRIMRKELEHARYVYLQARNVAGERYRADLIGQNGRTMRERLDVLDAVVEDLVGYLEPVADLVRRLDLSLTSAMWSRLQVRRVLDPGSWAEAADGLARGRGVPGYDTPEGVAAARQAAQVAHERYRAAQAHRRASKAPRGKPRAGRGGPGGAPLLQQD